MATELNKGNLSIHTENIFPIIKKWLYSEHDIFIRELVANAMDAMNKRIVLDENADREKFEIEVKIDKKKKTIQFIDDGIGMSEEEILKYINQIAFSGAEDFIEKFKDKQSNIIGHFGLGFYSSFMVADKVTIDSLSMKEGAIPAFWECDGSTEYKSGVGKRKKIGTTITVFLNNESEKYLEESKTKELLEKFCNFMPFSIKLGKDIVNQKEALWNKKPKDVTDEEYKEFYKSLFHDYQDPLFWIHLNVDFPFNLKGILYFPKIKNQLDINRGEVKLYCNNVFVANNLKELVPEFLLLLKGGIDIPDIPLNVSRSFLQHDKEVKKITGYIIKKVGDHLKSIFKEDREKYNGFWEDINDFIKYGILTDEKFADSMRDFIIFKSSNGDYVTLPEFKERNKSESKPQKIYYAPSEDTQVSYLNLMKEQGIEVLMATSVLDNHIFQQLETKDSDVTFVRVDSEINDLLINSDEAEEVDDNNQTLSEKLKEIFEVALNEKIEASYDKDSYKEFLKKYPKAVEILSSYIRTENDSTFIKPYDLPMNVRTELGSEAFKAIVDKTYSQITADVKKVKAKNISGMIVFNEQMRRFSEMNSMNGMGANNGFDMLGNHTMVINAENETIKKIAKLHADGEKEKVKLLCEYIHELALLEQKRFSGKELQGFVEKANKILSMV